MKSHEAIQKAIAGKTVEHAKNLGLSTSLLNKWQEPSTDWTDSGAYNPLDRIESIIEKALALGADPADALAPIIYLEERFNRIGHNLPDIKNCDILSVLNELSKVIEEFSDLARAGSEAINNDGRIDPFEYKRIKKEGWEAIRQIRAFMSKAEKHSQGG